MLANLRRCGDQSTCPPPVPCLHTASTMVSSTCAINSERRGVGVLRPRKAMRAFWQKWSSWLWRSPSETTSNLVTSVMTRNKRLHLGVYANWNSCNTHAICLNPRPHCGKICSGRILTYCTFESRSSCVETKGSVWKENIEFWHIEVHVQVRFESLFHFSRAQQGFGQTSYNGNIVTNAHHPAVEVSFTDPSNLWMNSNSKANSL